MIVKGDTDWEVAIASMKIRFSRREDAYDSVLFYTLYDAARPALTRAMVGALSTNDQVQMVERDGYCFQRTCPHAQEDLTHGQIKDGILTCPRHFWQWDLKTGHCVRGGKLPLNIGAAAPAK